MYGGGGSCDIGMTMLITADDYANRTKLVSYLAGELRNGRLAILLGAGISMPFGLPSWDRLLADLYDSASALPPPKRDLKRQADHFRRQYCGNSEERFAGEVHKILYSRGKFGAEALRRNATIGAIGALVMASRRGSVSSVITFNYDDLLEKYLAFFGFVTESVFEERHWKSTADVVIYHPHGYLPSDRTRRSSATIVLGQRSYTRLAAAERNWLRQELLTILRTTTCLFIGLSGLDENLELLLEEARSAHAVYTRTPSPPYWGVSFALDNDDVTSQEWEERGVWCHRVRNYSRALPAVLFQICQEAARLQAGDLPVRPKPLRAVVSARGAVR